MSQTEVNIDKDPMNSAYWDRRYNKKKMVWSAEANHFLTEETRSLKPGRAFDLATGEGRNAVWLAEQGWAVDAVDFSPVGINKGKRLAEVRNVSGNITWLVEDLATYTSTPGRYDLVAVIYLQIPLIELKPILLNAVKALKPGGTFLLVGHDTDNLEHGYGGPQRPDILYRAQDVVEMVGDMIQIQKAEQVKRPVEAARRHYTALDCLVRGTLSAP